MADVLWNDIIYTDVLQSDGFVIDYAVCTTYIWTCLPCYQCPLCWAQ